MTRDEAKACVRDLARASDIVRAVQVRVRSLPRGRPEDYVREWLALAVSDLDGAASLLLEIVLAPPPKEKP